MKCNNYIAQITSEEREGDLKIFKYESLVIKVGAKTRFTTDGKSITHPSLPNSVSANEILIKPCLTYSIGESDKKLGE